MTSMNDNDRTFDTTLLPLVQLIEREFPDRGPVTDLDAMDVLGLDWDDLTDIEPELEAFLELCETLGGMVATREQAVQLWEGTLDRKLHLFVGPDETVYPDPFLRRPEAFELAAEMCRDVLLQRWDGSAYA